MPLSMARPGERVRIREIKGGRGIVGKLADMGLYPGIEIVVVSNRSGPLILKRGGVRMGLGYGMAQRIIVSPIL
jgi:Fe2+ transport system protein FeoA